MSGGVKARVHRDAVEELVERARSAVEAALTHMRIIKEGNSLSFTDKANLRSLDHAAHELSCVLSRAQ